jgi:hypothetical protein
MQPVLKRTLEIQAVKILIKLVQIFVTSGEEPSDL